MSLHVCICRKHPGKMIICWGKKKKIGVMLCSCNKYPFWSLCSALICGERSPATGMLLRDAAVICLYILSCPGKILAARIQAGLCKGFLNRFSLCEETEFPNYNPNVNSCCKFVSLSDFFFQWEVVCCCQKPSNWFSWWSLVPQCLGVGQESNYCAEQ